jgi:cell division control protein 24
MCITLRQRLLAVPGFDEYFLETEQQHEDLDVVQLIWKTFQLGHPLVSLYNILRPDQPVEIDVSKISAAKQGKALTSSFLRGCINGLNFSVEDCFILYDLYQDDIGGFVKVITSSLHFTLLFLICLGRKNGLKAARHHGATKHYRRSSP